MTLTYTHLHSIEMLLSKNEFSSTGTKELSFWRGSVGPQSLSHSPQSIFYLQYTSWYCAWGNLQETQQSQHHINLSSNFEFAMVLQWWKSFRNLACSLTASRFLFHQTGRGKLSSSSQRLYFGTKGKQNVYKPSRSQALACEVFLGV